VVKIDVSIKNSDLKKALKDKQIPETDFIMPKFGKTYFFAP